MIGRRTEEGCLLAYQSLTPLRSAAASRTAFADGQACTHHEQGLLALPEDVLMKIVCNLSHDEIKPLFQVCAWVCGGAGACPVAVCGAPPQAMMRPST